MAGNVCFSVKDPKSANDWLAKVMAINEDYHKAMKDAGEALLAVEEASEGTIVDEMVTAGHNILSAAEATFDAINTIASTVNTILDKIGGLTRDVVGLFGEFANMIGG